LFRHLPVCIHVIWDGSDVPPVVSRGPMRLDKPTGCNQMSIAINDIEESPRRDV
jgi:hypothetical protein